MRGGLGEGMRADPSPERHPRQVGLQNEAERVHGEYLEWYIYTYEYTYMREMRLT